MRFHTVAMKSVYPNRSEMKSLRRPCAQPCNTGQPRVVIRTASRRIETTTWNICHGEGEGGTEGNRVRSVKRVRESTTVSKELRDDQQEHMSGRGVGKKGKNTGVTVKRIKTVEMTIQTNA